MDVDQSLDAIIKAQPKKKTANANARGKAGASMKKSSSSFGLQKSKQSNKQIAQKSKQMKVAVRPVSRGAIKKPTRKPVGGRAIGMAIDGHISTGGGSIVRGSANQSKTSNEQPTKLIVSNLDFNVTEKDIKDLFSTVARLKTSSLNYGPNGKSKGSGEVIFFNRADALAAMREYSGMKLDGRELKLEIIATSNVGGRGNIGGGRGSRGGPQRMDVIQQPKKQTAATKKAKKPRKPKAAKSAPKQPLTAEALDAGLDAYKAQAMES